MVETIIWELWRGRVPIEWHPDDRQQVVLSLPRVRASWPRPEQDSAGIINELEERILEVIDA